MQDRIAIFRAGTHRDEKGRTWTFSEGDLAAIAAGYDPANHQAPHVLGHPKTDAPAWGWTKGLEVENGVLYETREQVDPAFAEAVDAGRYKFRSASFYEPNDPANPTPGSWHLKHVGWLGAQPPAVKGLGPAFAEGDASEGVTFAEGDMNLAWLAGNVAEGFRQIRDWILGKWGQEEADKALSAWTDRAATQIAADVRAEARAEPGAAFAEAEAALVSATAATALIDRRAAELDAREAAIAAREAATRSDQVAFAEAARVAARDDDAAFVDQLVTQGRLPPARADLVKNLLGVLDGDSTVAFAEGEAGARDQMRELLGGLGVSINFGEVAPQAGVRFAETRTAEEHARIIQEVMAEASAAGRTISAAEAASIARNR